jgi:hypothetical protein
MRSVPRCTTHNQDLAEARTRDFRKVHPGTPGLESLSKMLSTVCLRISRCMTCQSVWVSVSYTNASFVWAFCRTFDCRQGSAGGSFSSATCTHDAPSLCNLKKNCYSSSAVQSTDITLEQEAGRDPLAHTFLRNCFLTWGGLLAVRKAAGLRYARCFISPSQKFITQKGQVMVCDESYITRAFRPLIGLSSSISITKQFNLLVTQSIYLLSSLLQTALPSSRTPSSPSTTMPSNTSHIQQRAQLVKHDDLVVPTNEHTEWQDVQNELGLAPDFQSIGAPVRACAVSSLHSTSEDLTAKQGPGSPLPRLRSLRDCRKEMPKLQDSNLAIQARYVL